MYKLVYKVVFGNFGLHKTDKKLITKSCTPKFKIYWIFGVRKMDWKQFKWYIGWHNYKNVKQYATNIWLKQEYVTWLVYIT